MASKASRAQRSRGGRTSTPTPLLRDALDLNRFTLEAERTLLGVDLPSLAHIDDAIFPWDLAEVHGLVEGGCITLLLHRARTHLALPKMRR